MFIMNVATDDPIRIMRKYEEKPVRLMSVTCPESGKKFLMVYAWDN